MKKILANILLMSAAMTANAQISNLDEIELVGKWDVYGFGGTYSNIPFEYRYGNTPKYLTLSDGDYTVFKFPKNDWVFKGYWLSHTDTGKYILHLLPWNSDNSIVNFVVTKFDNDELYLTTYDGKGWVEFRKSDNTDGIQSVSADSKGNGKAYNLSGLEVNENAKGVIIKNGKKQYQ